MPRQPSLIDTLKQLTTRQDPERSFRRGALRRTATNSLKRDEQAAKNHKKNFVIKLEEPKRKKRNK